MRHKCMAYRLIDGQECSNPAKYEVRYGGILVNYVCGIHARAYTPKALVPLAETERKRR